MDIIGEKAAAAPARARAVAERSMAAVRVFLFGVTKIALRLQVRDPRVVGVFRGRRVPW
jgi:hypothetical protein